MTKLKLFSSAALTALSMALLAAPASATVVVPAADSGPYYLEFASEGSTIAEIDNVANSDFSLTLLESSVVTYSIIDCCIVGDTYDAVFDGSTVSWSSEGFTGTGGLWEGSLTQVLAAGSYTFGAIIDGTRVDVFPAHAWASFEVAAVPIPAAGLMLLLGVGALGAVGRRRRKS